MFKIISKKPTNTTHKSVYINEESPIIEFIAAAFKDSSINIECDFTRDSISLNGIQTKVYATNIHKHSTTLDYDLAEAIVCIVSDEISNYNLGDTCTLMLRGYLVPTEDNDTISVVLGMRRVKHVTNRMVVSKTEDKVMVIVGNNTEVEIIRS